MQKPNGYDEVSAGNFEKAEVGGHYAVIKGVKETTSSIGKDMIVVAFDFDKNDRQPGYFQKLFDNDERDDKKWPFAGTKYIMVYDYAHQNMTSRNFKSFCSAFEDSNDTTVNWSAGANWGKQFTGKKIGVTFGTEEQEYDGKTSMRNIPKWFCNYAKVPDQPIPQVKYLQNKQPTTVQTDDFMTIQEAETDGIPF